MDSKILAGIIVYDPDKNLIRLVDALIKQEAEVILFINRGNQISNYITKNRNIIHQNNEKNIGISGALNYIINQFLKRSFSYLFTFDQDSMIDPFFIKNMLLAFEKSFLENKKIVCCAPTIIDIKFKNKENNQTIFEKAKNNFQVQYVNFAITSGSLFNRESFSKVGIMNKLLFIDGVDTDWCERAIIQSFRIVKANNIFLKHKIGSKYINFFGIRKSYHDQDLRVYYIMRNSLYLLIHGSNTFRWKISEIIRTFVRLIAYPFLSSTKFKTLFFIFLAIKDVIKMKMGKMEYIEH